MAHSLASVTPPKIHSFAEYFRSVKNAKSVKNKISHKNGFFLIYLSRYYYGQLTRLFPTSIYYRFKLCKQTIGELITHRTCVGNKCLTSVNIVRYLCYIYLIKTVSNNRIDNSGKCGYDTTKCFEVSCDWATTFIHSLSACRRFRVSAYAKGIPRYLLYLYFHLKCKRV